MVDKWVASAAAATMTVLAVAPVVAAATNGVLDRPASQRSVAIAQPPVNGHRPLPSEWPPVNT
ncbi:hypothetical protein GCM10029978_021080 [Actinoallomurus acanthiterrae]